MNDAKWMDLYQKVNAHRDEAVRRGDEIVWAILAGGDGHQIFGKPIKVTVEWPEGLPRGFGWRTPEDVQRYAAEKLAELRRASS